MNKLANKKTTSHQTFLFAFSFLVLILTNACNEDASPGAGSGLNKRPTVERRQNPRNSSLPVPLTRIPIQKAQAQSCAANCYQISPDSKTLYFINPHQQFYATSIVKPGKAQKISDQIHCANKECFSFSEDGWVAGIRKNPDLNGPNGNIAYELFVAKLGTDKLDVTFFGKIPSIDLNSIPQFRIQFCKGSHFLLVTASAREKNTLLFSYDLNAPTQAPVTIFEGDQDTPKSVTWDPVSKNVYFIGNRSEPTHPRIESVFMANPETKTLQILDSYVSLPIDQKLQSLILDSSAAEKGLAGYTINTPPSDEFPAGFFYANRGTQAAPQFTLEYTAHGQRIDRVWTATHGGVPSLVFTAVSISMPATVTLRTLNLETYQSQIIQTYPPGTQVGQNDIFLNSTRDKVVFKTRDANTNDTVYMVYDLKNQDWKEWGRFASQTDPNYPQQTTDVLIRSAQVTSQDKNLIVFGNFGSFSLFELFSVDPTSPSKKPARINAALPKEGSILFFSLTPDAQSVIYLADLYKPGEFRFYRSSLGTQ